MLSKVINFFIILGVGNVSTRVGLSFISNLTYSRSQYISENMWNCRVQAIHIL
jgi:hypothetical protein